MDVDQLTAFQRVVREGSALVRTQRADPGSPAIAAVVAALGAQADRLGIIRRTGSAGRR